MMMTCSDPDCFLCRRLPVPLSRAAHANPQVSLWIVVAIMFGLALGVGVAVSGCGSVTPDAAQLQASLGGAGGLAGAPGGQAGGLEATGGATGGQDGGGQAAGADGRLDAGTDACVSVPGVRYCDPNAQPCPASLPLASCPGGTVLAGDGGTCPIGKTYVAVFEICIPADGG